MSSETFTEAVETYLEDADWIGESDPTAFGLRKAATQLDKAWATSLWTEYNKTIRYLDTLKPVETEEEEDDDLAPVVGLETRGA